MLRLTDIYWSLQLHCHSCTHFRNQHRVVTPRFFSRGPSSYLDPQRDKLLEVLCDLPLVECLKFGQGYDILKHGEPDYVLKEL